jgi:hypothetical protein
MRDYFGVSIGRELESRVLQTLAQRFMIFNDAVVHYGNFRDFTGKMGMGVAFGRCAMSGPAGVRNSYFTSKILLLCELAELRNPASGAQAAQSAVHQRQASGVITPVFETPQTFK